MTGERASARERERLGVLADVHEQRGRQAQRLRLDERTSRALRASVERAVELAARGGVLADVEVEQAQAAERLGLAARALVADGIDAACLRMWCTSRSCAGRLPQPRRICSRSACTW